MKIKHILIVTDAPSPYKIEFLREIQKKFALHILFLSQTLSDRDQRWFASCEGLSYAIVGNRINQMKYGLTMNIDEYDLFWNMNYTNPLSLLLARRFRRCHKPVLMHADGGIYHDRGWIMNHIIEWAMKHNDYFTSSGIMTDQYYEGYHIDSKLIYHYHFSSIHEKDVVDHPRETMHRPVRLLSVGQPINRKGFDIILKALIPYADQHKFTLTIVGGMANTTCQTILDDYPMLKNIVAFVPFMVKDELCQYYRDADYFIFMTREDIWGLVVNEALAYGLPVIGSDQCAALVEINRQYDVGMVLPIKYGLDLSVIEDRMLNAQQYQKWSAHALDAAHAYTIEQMVIDYLRIFKLIESKGERQ